MKYFDLETRKAAHKAQQKVWYLKNREISIERAKRWQEANPERFRELRNKWAKNNRPKVTPRQRALKYGLTRPELEQMTLQRNNRCDICGRHPSGTRPTLHIDHNHLTGQVRGLLCNSCNLSVGWAEKFFVHERKFLRQIFKYLKHPPTQDV